MKKTIAIILIAASMFTLSSCKLIRKATEKEPAEPAQTEEAESISYSTEFSSEAPKETEAAVRYSEAEAIEVLSHSFPDYEPEEIKIESTGSLIAQDDGTEYYILNVTLPSKDTESDDADMADETEETEAKAEPATFYVSVNGVVHSELETSNVDTKFAENTFYSKKGEKNEAGAAYKLVYEGLVRSKDNLCYDFAVYTKDGDSETYVTNYLVTIDGKLSAESTKTN